jgi:hypothetical protein
MTVPYAEGLWIAPKYRKQGPVGLRLWRKMVELVKGLPASAMMTSADTDMMRDLIARRGGVMLPATVHLVPVRK